MDFLSLLADLDAPAPFVQAPPPAPADTGVKRDRSVGTTQAAHAVVPKGPITISSQLKARLFEHQVKGVDWLCERHRSGCGCILADEMGLGKTIQVAVFVGEAMRSGAIKSAVIVVLPTLVPMWEKALREWAGLHTPVVSCIHKGSKASREKQWGKLRHGTNAVIITTYGIVKSDVAVAEKYASDYIILDEAHTIKDPSGESFKAVVRMQAVHKIAMTGTPLMNSFNDLWALMQFADRRVLSCSRADFSRSNAAIVRGNERDAHDRERGTADAQLQDLQRLIAPYILRRLKTEVTSCAIASKSEFVLWLRMTEGQEDQYRSFLASDTVKVALKEIDTSQPLVLMTSLKKICDHPWLNFNQMNFSKAMLTPNNAPDGFDDFGTIDSPKLTVALQLVQLHLSEGKKTLIFSRSKKLLDMMGLYLVAHSLRYARVDGDTPSEDRCRTAEAFNASPDVGVCLLTTQVGGVGITFSGASRVVLLDPSWNPAVDAQAVDRVHRIGQTDDVLVYRLIMSGTVDEMIYRNQIFKMMASKQALMSAEDRSQLHRYFTHTQLRNMFEVGNINSSVTASHLETVHPNEVPPAIQAAFASEKLSTLVTNISSHTAMFAATTASDDKPIVPEPKVVKRRRKKTDVISTQSSQSEVVDAEEVPSLSQLAAIPDEVPNVVLAPVVAAVEVVVPTIPLIPTLPPRPLNRCSIFDQGICLDEDDARDARQLYRGISFDKLKMSMIHRQSIDVNPGLNMLDSWSGDEEASEGSVVEASDVADADEPFPVDRGSFPSSLEDGEEKDVGRAAVLHTPDSLRTSRQKV